MGIHPPPYTQAQNLNGRLVQKNISLAMIITHNIRYDKNDYKKQKIELKCNNKIII